MDVGWVRNCKDRVMLLFKEMHLSFPGETVKNNTRTAVAWSVFEGVTARKQVYLLVCSPSGSCWRRQV